MKDIKKGEDWNQVDGKFINVIRAQKLSWEPPI